MELTSDTYSWGGGRYVADFEGRRYRMSQRFVSFPCYPFPSSYKPIPLAQIHVHLSPDMLELPHLSPIRHKLHVWQSQWKIKVQQGYWRRRNGQVSISLGKSWFPIPRQSYTSSVKEGKLRSACPGWCSRLAIWGSVLPLPLLTRPSSISSCSP